VVWSFIYLAVRRVVELVLLCCRSTQAKEVEILVLRVGARNSGVGPELRVRQRSYRAAMIDA
jgi:hypothetical protein